MSLISVPPNCSDAAIAEAARRRIGRIRPAPQVSSGEGASTTAKPRWKRLRATGGVAGHIDTAERSNEPIEIYVEESDPEEHGDHEHAPGLDVIGASSWLTLINMLTMTLPNLLSDRSIPSTGLPTAAVELLRDVFQVPRQLFLILGVLHQSEAYSDTRDLYLVEYFCGAGAVWRNVQTICGLPTLGYDIAHGPSEDFNSDTIGFITALQWWRRLMACAWIWLGTVCSTWVFMCLASTGRSTTVPRGNTRQSCVREGNRHVGRSALLMSLQYATKRGFMLEQPGTSLMLKSHAMLWIKRCADHIGSHFFVIDTYMGAFASQHLKHTLLCSNRLNVCDLRAPRPALVSAQTAVTKFVDKNGRRRCTGNKGELKATQQYTETFGQAVATAMKETLTPEPYAKFFDDYEQKETLTPTEVLPTEDDDDYEEHPWCDVELQPVLEFLLNSLRD